MAPSPMAEATRLTDRGRTFPAVNTPGHGCPGQHRRTLKRPVGRPAGTGRGRRPGNLARPPSPQLSTFPQPRLSTARHALTSEFAEIIHKLVHG